MENPERGGGERWRRYCYCGKGDPQRQRPAERGRKISKGGMGCVRGAHWKTVTAHTIFLLNKKASRRVAVMMRSFPARRLDERQQRYEEREDKGRRNSLATVKTISFRWLSTKTMDPQQRLNTVVHHAVQTILLTTTRTASVVTSYRSTALSLTTKQQPPKPPRPPRPPLSHSPSPGPAAPHSCPSGYSSLAWSRC